ncbi:hypothetical protein ACP4OV_017827 [Aristida adscensionis]
MSSTEERGLGLPITYLLAHDARFDLTPRRQSTSTPAFFTPGNATLQSGEHKVIISLAFGLRGRRNLPTDASPVFKYPGHTQPPRRASLITTSHTSQFPLHMDAADEVTFEFVPVIRQYRSGRVERLLPTNPVPPSLDAATGVASRDVTIDPATGLWARLYLPDLPASAGARLPVVLYFHGGGLVVGTAADAPEHAFLNRLAARAGAIAVSVEYRLAPEHPVPACYDDAWTALRWVIAAAAGSSTSSDAAPEPWLRDHGDVGRVSLLGYSAGGNVAHNVALRAGGGGGEEGLPGGARLRGMALMHPFFLSGDKAEGEVKHAWARAKIEEMWAFACGGRTAGVDDPRVNPLAGGALSLRAALGCDRVLVCVADDELEVRGKAYHGGLLASGWAKEDAELLDSAGEEHDFHLRQPESPNALLLVDRLAAFLRGNQ